MEVYNLPGTHGLCGAGLDLEDGCMQLLRVSRVTPKPEHISSTEFLSLQEIADMHIYRAI